MSNIALQTFTNGGNKEDQWTTTTMITNVKERNNNTSKVVQMRNVVLEMLHDILCEGNNNINNSKEMVTKFATTITNRWPLLFFGPNLHPFTVVLAARILSRILITQGTGYINKFRTSSEGFLILLQSLPPHYWSLTQLHETLIITMMGIDIAQYPMYTSFQIDNIKQCIQQNQHQSGFLIPDIMPIIVALWRESVHAAVQPLIDDSLGNEKKS